MWLDNRLEQTVVQPAANRRFAGVRRPGDLRGCEGPDRCLVEAELADAVESVACPVQPGTLAQREVPAAFDGGGTDRQRAAVDAAFQRGG